MQVAGSASSLLVVWEQLPEESQRAKTDVPQAGVKGGGMGWGEKPEPGACSGYGKNLGSYHARNRTHG